MSSKDRSFIIIIAVLVVFFSTLSGFAGGMVAGKYVQSKNKAAGVTSTEIPVTKSDSSEGRMNVKKVVKAVKNSVVSIECKVQNTGGYYFSGGTSTAAGSGVIITTNGYIVTNNHVVEGATEITVKTADKESYSAKIIGTDPQTDIAVIKIDAKGLSAASFGTSKNLEVGDEVVAIGNPLGQLSGTVTNGIVSALDREVTVNNETMSLIQTDASINAGNSGGGMFDSNGLLVGIVNAKASGDGVEGLGFAIPIDTAKKVIEQLMDNGYVKGRVTSGLTLIDVLDEQTAYQYGVNNLGVYIYSVTEGSNAERAGLKSGYMVTKLNGKKIEKASTFKSMIKKMKVGDEIKVTVSNGLREATVKYKLQESK